MKKRIGLVIAALIMMLTVMIPAAGIPVSASTGLSLSELKAKFPADKYWNKVNRGGNNENGWTDSPCPSHVNVSNCNAFTYNGVEIGWQCFGFACKLGYDAYGTNPKNWQRVYNLDTIKPGDIINYNGNNPGHTVFVIGVSGDMVTFAECNWGGRCIISWGRSLHKYEFSNLLSVYVAPYVLDGGSVTPDICDCSVDYAGTYTCVTTQYPLIIRSGHGTGFSAIGSIPSGATVTVTKANGNWAHVEYDGKSGYASMQYLAVVVPTSNKYPVPFKSYPLSDANHAAEAFDSVNGTRIGYVYGTDYCTINEIYENGWCLANIPWGSSGGRKDVYTKLSAFLNTSVTPYTKVVESKATTYIRSSGTSTLGWIDPGDKITVVDDTSSSRKQIIYPHTVGIYRCAWVESSALVHNHTPGAAATCTTPQVCTTCDAVIENAKGHKPGTAATCISPQKCTSCGVTLQNELGHNAGAAATCISAQKCTRCGTILQNALGHAYSAVRYELDHPHAGYQICTVCGERHDTGTSTSFYNCEKCHAVTGITIILPSGERADSETVYEVIKDYDVSFSIEIEPSDALNKDVIWSSSNTKIATVTQDGLVTGVSSGQTVITVATTDGSITASCKVRVTLGAAPYEAPTITFENASGLAGKTVTVKVNLSKNNWGITGALISINYDTSLTLESVEKGDAFDSLEMTVSNTPYPNPVKISWDGERNDYSNGTLVVLTFSIPDSAGIREYPISLSYERNNVYDENFQTVELITIDGKIEVKELLFGDVNCDGIINGMDATAIRRFITGGYTLEYFDESAADVNHDGVVNGMDITLIRRYLTGGYGVELN